MNIDNAFQKLGVIPPIISSILERGYEEPTPIQELSIPVLIRNCDLLAQAQTGTGKTAAFALPILSNLNIKNKRPQAIVVVPTRELAIQVSEAFQNYAKHLKDFHVVPIYGGQEYRTQLRALQRGAHVIVGTPGRLMDHLRRGVLSLVDIGTVILDEADEMLKMGFIDDIEWILNKIPQKHQTALFSATMPVSIRKITKNYLQNPEKIHIKPQENTLDSIEQFYLYTSQSQKVEVLTRFLENEDITGSIVFVRTKNNSNDLAEKLQARGYAATALNGGMNQSARKKAVQRFKNNELDIIVATDLAARGLDLVRISHVINFDIPCDAESYIHRIGRTGRAGRKGHALLFVTQRENRLFKEIKKAVHSQINQAPTPSLSDMKEKHLKQLTTKVIDVLKSKKNLEDSHKIIEAIIELENYDPKDIAAALAYLTQKPKLPVALTPQKEKRSFSYKSKKKSFGRPSSKRKPKAKSSYYKK